MGDDMLATQVNTLTDQLAHPSGGPDGDFANELLRRLDVVLSGGFDQSGADYGHSSSKLGSLAFQNVSQEPRDPYHVSSLRDEVSLTSSDEDEHDYTVESGGMSKSRLSSTASPQRKKAVKSLAQWEDMHYRRKQKLHSKQQKRDAKKAATLEAAEKHREQERAKVDALARKALEKKLAKEEETGSEITTLKKWRETFGSRLEKYEAQKQQKFSKLRKQIREAHVAKQEKERPPKLTVIKDEAGNPIGGMKWSDGVPCKCENVADVLEDNRWVYKRLMMKTKQKVRNNIQSQEKARREAALRELEECYFEPQLKSSRRVPKFPDVRDPKRQLGYEPKPYYGKMHTAGSEYTFTPQINDKSREMVDPRLYASTDEVCRRLAKANQRRVADVGSEDRSEGMDKDFMPHINKRSDDMARDVNVFDRLYNIGMQQMIEKRRMQSEFWENYTRLEQPFNLNMPPKPFDPYSKAFSEGDSLGGTVEPGYDLSQSGAFRGESTAPPMGTSTSAMGDTITPMGADGQNLSLGMSAAEFLAMYSGR